MGANLPRKVVEQVGDVVGNTSGPGFPVPNGAHRNAASLGDPFAGQPQRFTGGLQLRRGHVHSLP